jgi:hypothetical protein
MGCCSSCLGRNENDNGGCSSAAETEMRAQNDEATAKVLAVARGMSAPTIDVIQRTKVTTKHNDDDDVRSHVCRAVHFVSYKNISTFR